MHVERPFVSLLLIGLSFAIGSLHADDANLAPRRWAVLASPAAWDSGIADIVFTSLSDIREIELVERERLDAIVAEISLEALFRSDREERRRVGRVLDAEFLLVFHQPDATVESRTEVVCIDCRRGIRLKTTYISVEPAKLESEGVAVCHAVRDTVKTFSDGVTQIVGVSPLVSMNTVHRHDYLQSGFAELIQTGLLKIPGVAVVEMDEARAIQRERSLSDVDAIQRILPVLIDGDYRVTVEDGNTANVVIDIRIQRSVQLLETVSLGPMPLPEASRYLLKEFSKSVVNGDSADGNIESGLSLESQHRWLTTQALRFAELGVWDEAASLREAALLLQPDDGSLRVALLGTYREIFRDVRTGRFKFWSSIDDPVEIRRLFQRKETAYLAGLGHLEYLIRNEALDAIQAIDWTQRYSTAQLLGSTPLNLRPLLERAHLDARRECLASVESAKERFLFDVFPRVLRFSSSPPVRAVQHARDRVGIAGGNVATIIAHRWQDICVELMLRRSDRDTPNADDFDFILRMMTTRIPDGLRSTSEMTHFLNARGLRFRFQTPQMRISNRREWKEFLAKLERSDHKMARLHARFAQLAPVADTARSLPEERRTQVVKQIREFQREYAETLRTSGHPGKTSDGWLYGMATNWLRRITPTVSVDGSPPRRSDTVSANTQSAPTGRLTFRELDLQLVQEDGQRTDLRDFGRTVQITSTDRMLRVGGSRTLRGIVQCGDNLDAMWGPWTLYLMSEPGVARTIIRRNVRTFREVIWDGHSIWVATEQGEIWQVSRDGQVQLTLTSEHGLLPSDHGLSIASVSQGRLIAAGSFGRHQRGWCAEITAPQGQPPQVRIFHEATHVAQPTESGENVELLPDLCFTPTGLHLFETSDDSGRDAMLVGRKNRRRSLVVDLKTSAVTVFDRALAEVRRDSLFSRAGNTLQPSIEGVYLNSIPERGRVRSVTNLCPTRHLVGNLNALRRKVLQYDGWLYVPGEVWWRINPVSFKAELLTPRRLPNGFAALYRFDTSAHYGILAWNLRHIYQVNPPSRLPVERDR
ncbi:MAG: hypothetical protein QGG71_13550 [Pirellulaceae bacterium]|nr:hypothetical protein [Pirellulaceae bacterium]